MPSSSMPDLPLLDAGKRSLSGARISSRSCSGENPGALRERNPSRCSPKRAAAQLKPPDVQFITGCILTRSSLWRPLASPWAIPQRGTMGSRKEAPRVRRAIFATTEMPWHPSSAGSTRIDGRRRQMDGRDVFPLSGARTHFSPAPLLSRALGRSRRWLSPQRSGLCFPGSPFSGRGETWPCRGMSECMR